MFISSINNQLVKDTVKLHKKKNRDQTGLFLVEGYHLYEEAKLTPYVKTVFTTDDAIQGINVVHVTEEVLEKLAQTKSPSPIICVCTKIDKKEITDKVLILEEIQDPGNLGTLLRSALGFGFDTIVLDKCVDVYNDKVLRSTQGMIFKLNLVEMNTMNFIEQNSKYKVYGTEMNGSSITEIEASKFIALVLGNEGSGLSKTVLNRTYKNIAIKTKIESLNVGVAGSIIMHHISSMN